ncbi:MAG: 2-isopropylmalate synthase [uncultured Phycisphaerae bacterium]|uniref:2-isopropylmalate synthase n=1 Tax=uncultured Phycisphaerae bacterium TaxID=904963 RepID=A0A6J4N301_9BACT|nr:MAG: 2-isopropylmalate synthase [uncultured Phycisphaerae bacterium]
MDTVRIFDTTLRDGEQSPGATLTLPEKLEIARHLEAMGVDVIEAGFPVSSEGDFESVRAIAGEVTASTVCGLARCTPRDIERAGEAVRHAARPRVHLFLATSKIHRDHKLRKGKEEILRLAVESIKQAREYTPDIEFSPEDASRTELEFLEEMVIAAVEAGATTINMPDTVGYATPKSYGEIFAHIGKLPIVRERNVILSSHCHNDLGLAVANSLAAVENGARQVECTINGIGERAGNAALEEVVMALRTRADHYKIGTRIDTTKIVPISRMVSTLTGLVVQRNKAIVGENAFAHESGIHQDGVLKYRETYEIMDPATVGLAKNSLVLGKHSGRHAFRDRVTGLGYTLNDEQIEHAFVKFKALADKKKEVFDEDIEALVDDELELTHGLWELVRFQALAGSAAIPMATVVLRDSNGAEVSSTGGGDGPVDAVYSAIQRLTGIEVVVRDYRIRAVTRGKDAQGEAQVELEHSGRRIRGRGLSTDILEASALAYLAAINRLRSIGHRERLVTQHSGV